MDAQFAVENKGDEYIYDMERQQAAHERQAFMNRQRPLRRILTQDMAACFEIHFF